MSLYNLVDEKWIPVHFADGSRDELGIRDTLLRAKEISAIEDQSPLVIAALHRFLLAVLYRALEGPIDIDQARILFNEGLPGEKIVGYLKRWRERFWLFDEKYPVFQVQGYEPKKKNGHSQWRPWTAMAAEHNANNAKVLFDHVDIAKPGTIVTRKAACWLIACQTFSVGGGNSDFQYTKSGPSATSVLVLPVGANLHDTLLLSLVPENREVLKSDLPVWEREPEPIESLKKGVERAISGFADLYSWRTRSVKFELRGEGKEVSGLAFASGTGCSSEGYTDPMVAYRVDKKRGKLPIQFRDRGLWRDFDSLLPDSSNLAPMVMGHAANLTQKCLHRFPRSVLALGQANSQAKIEYWRMERFVFPAALSGDRYIREDIRQILNDSEDAQKALWKACSYFAKDLLSRGGRKIPNDDVSKFVQQMPVISWYWSTLEFRFYQIISEYSLDRDPDDIRFLWIKSVKTTLWEAWELQRTSVFTGDAWSIRALVKAEAPIRQKLKKLADEIQKLEPQKEEA